MPKTCRLLNANSWDNPDEICCPFCEEPMNLEWEDVSYSDGDFTDIECYSCLRKVSILTNVTYNFHIEIPDDEVEGMIIAKRNQQVE